VFYRGSVYALLLVLLALLGSMLVSYVRAKSEAMSLSLAGGLMRRHERIAYLTAGLLLGPLLHLASSPVEAPLTLLAVAVVAVVSNIAAVSLTRAARAALVLQGRGPKGRA
jgi:CDP-diacylglycerol--glycerol-3-phosphate 3-phosphatidyltransferase